MSSSRSNSRPRVPVPKDSKPSPSKTTSSTVKLSNRTKPTQGASTVTSKITAAKNEKSKSQVTSKISGPATKVPVPAAKTTNIKNTPTRKPPEPVRGVSRDRQKASEASGKANTPSQLPKQNISSPTKKVTNTKPSKSVPVRNGTATISKTSVINGEPKKPSKPQSKPAATEKARKPPDKVNLSGSKTATKEKPTKKKTPETTSESSDKEERPSTVNLSSQRGENRVIRNADSIIANNEAVLSASSLSKPTEDPDSLDAEIDYEDDFEDYESDFEPDDEDYNDDESESPESDISYSEASHISNSEISLSETTKIPNQAVPVEISSLESVEVIKDKADEITIKPSTLNLYEGKYTSDSSLVTPMTPITVTPLTPTVPLMTPLTPSASFFNFAQAEHTILQKKNISRASELLELITLDKQTFNIYESPPANYEMFIQVFGNTNRKQVYVQTEISEDQVTQTDDIDMLDKWTQNPSHGVRAVGGDLIPEEIENWKVKVNGVKLNNFIINSSCLMLKILDEETTEVTQSRLNKCDADVPFGSGYFELKCLKLTADQPVIGVCFSEGQPTYLLSVHGASQEQNQDNSTICVWNLKNQASPEYVLLPKACASKCCFNPGNPTIIFAGMLDGSIALWDLREPDSQHKKLVSADMVMTCRTPTYSTAAIYSENSHHSAIVDLQTFVYENSFSSQGTHNGYLYENQFCNLLSLEDMGVLNIWTVIEVAKPDASGSETDLWLAPKGHLKLLKTSSVVVSSMLSPTSAISQSLRCFSFRIEPSNPHNLFITTDTGVVLHCTRQGHLMMPRHYDTEGDSKNVMCIAFSPHRLPQFITGCSDGAIYIYNTKSSKPLLKCMFGSHCIKEVQWSVIRPTVFFVLDSQLCIQVWDLAISNTAPQYIGDFQSDRITNFTVMSDKRSHSQWSEYMVTSSSSGVIKVFKLANSLISVTSDEYDLLRNMMNDL